MIDALFDWFGREGWIVINWWLLATVAGATVLPLVWRLLGGLPDRGYTLARPLGILLTAYTFWLLAVLGFVQNTAGNMILAWVIVLAVSVTVYVRADAAGNRFNLREWWRENRTVVIVGEVLFAVLLVSWAIFRAHQPELSTTEKPMDLAFMSAAQNTLNFPPNDPWFAGFSISYYYFGYVIAAMFSTLAGVSTTIGYSMHLALLFALAGTAIFGIVYNLVRSRYTWRATVTEADSAEISPRGRTPAVFTGLLAAGFLLILGSYQTPLVEIPYFSGTASDAYLEFWDVNQRRDPVAVSADGPAEWGYWWWFRSARAISDRNINDGHSEVIAEFPMFSFVLGDSHPHVMALPFVLLAMGLALNVLLSRQRPDRTRVLFYGLCIGALVFLNTWDAPVYIMVLVGADALRRLRRSGQFSVDDWTEMITLGLSLLVILFVAYLPFLIGFRSQLGGVLPNLINPTGFQQIFLLFGPFLLILPVYLAVEVWRSRQARRMNWGLAGQSALGILLIMLVLLAAFTLLGLISDSVRQTALGYIDANGGIGDVLGEGLARRLDPRALLTPVITVFVLLLIIGRLFPKPTAATSQPGRATGYPPANGFALMLIGVAFTLILIPEFVYLRDNFGSRMNTVFKFYYQAWVVLSVACAYGIYTVLADRDLPKLAVPMRGAFAVTLIGIIGAGLLFPVFAVRERAWIESGLRAAENPVLSMNGGPRFSTLDDYQAAMCLAELVGDEPVVVAEADPTANPSRVNYNPRHGRVGSLTGLPIVLGWPGHQSQWRGVAAGPEIDRRAADMRALYNDLRLDAVLPILDRYGIDYIFYGATERDNHGVAGEEKFRQAFPVVEVCTSGQTRIYAVPATGIDEIATR